MDNVRGLCCEKTALMQPDGLKVLLFLQEARVKRVNEDMLERGRKHAAVLKRREEQFMRYGCSSVCFPLASLGQKERSCLGWDDPERFPVLTRHA